MSGEKVRGMCFKVIRMRVVEQLGAKPETVTLDARFREDLEADSLDLSEVIMNLEDDFGVKIPDEEAQKLTTVDSAIRYVIANGGAPTEEALKLLAEHEAAG